MEMMAVFAIKINSALCAMLLPMMLSAASFAMTGTDDSLKKNDAKKTAPVETVAQKADIKQIIFEEQKIEGKIRRPQLVLIKADQRPDFAPMVMQAVGKTKSISALIDENLINNNTNTSPFKFIGTKVQYGEP
jgi:hypothetical protein